MSPQTECSWRSMRRSLSEPGSRVRPSISISVPSYLPRPRPPARRVMVACLADMLQSQVSAPRLRLRPPRPMESVCTSGHGGPAVELVLNCSAYRRELRPPVGRVMERNSMPKTPRRSSLPRRPAPGSFAASGAIYPFVFEQSPVPMWVVDGATLTVVAVNDAAVRDSGYTCAEIVGLTVTALCPSEDLARGSRHTFGAWQSDARSHGTAPAKRRRLLWRCT